jgi:hypothetical protein
MQTALLTSVAVTILYFLIYRSRGKGLIDSLGAALRDNVRDRL